MVASQTRGEYFAIPRVVLSSSSLKSFVFSVFLHGKCFCGLLEWRSSLGAEIPLHFTAGHRVPTWFHFYPQRCRYIWSFNFESYSQMKEQYLFCFIELFGRIILRYFRGEGWVLADGLARTRFVDLSVDHNNSLSLSLVIPRKFPVFLFSNSRFYWRIMPAIISSLA